MQPMKEITAVKTLSKKLFGAIPAGCLLMLSGCATTGQQAGSASTDRFAEADTNRDGKLSMDEGNNYFVGRIFDGRDLNHDGSLTWEEWNVPGAKQSKAKFNAADIDKSGSLSREEAQAYGRKHHAFDQQFKEADTNHDGFVTREEAQAYQASKEGPAR